MSDEAIRVLAGDCTVRSETGDDPPREERGVVLAVVKPDDTVLVHDRGGYRPAAWLTRAEVVSVRNGKDGPVIEAVDGDRRLVVTSHGEPELVRYPVTGVGIPSGACPGCDGALVRTATAVECLHCGARDGIPRDATLRADSCEACGKPTMQVERGVAFDICVDRDCDSLDDRVRERFDGVWECPTCGSPLRILRRGQLIAGCDAYPDCETGFAMPVGIQDGTCEACGLPSFTTASGDRCLDSRCPGTA